MTENRFVMVSERMGNGNINEFVKRNIDADRLALVCPLPGFRIHLPLTITLLL